MKIYGYLVIQNNSAVRWVKNKPSINNWEIAVMCNITIPDAFFDRLCPVINIELPESLIQQPDIEAIINISANEIAEKLRVSVEDATDGMRELLKGYEGGEQN